MCNLFLQNSFVNKFILSFTLKVFSQCTFLCKEDTLNLTSSRTRVAIWPFWALCLRNSISDWLLLSKIQDLNDIIVGYFSLQMWPFWFFRNWLLLKFSIAKFGLSRYQPYIVFSLEVNNFTSFTRRCHSYQHFTSAFLYERILSSFSLVTVWLWNF